MDPAAASAEAAGSTAMMDPAAAAAPARGGTAASSGNGAPQSGGAEDAPVPALVRVLAGNSVTGATILACLNTVDANALRELHPAVAGAVADVPWNDMVTRVVDTLRWRAALPAAVGTRLGQREVGGGLTSEPALAALAGVSQLDLHACAEYVTDELLHRLPASLRVLNVAGCFRLTPRAIFTHLPALVVLNCSETGVVNERTDGLPPSLVELDISRVVKLPAAASLAHLRQLRMLRASQSAMDVATLASLPPGLVELHADTCSPLTSDASFAHLPALQTLDVARCPISDATLARMPPSLVNLILSGSKELTRAVTLPHLPSLRLLDASRTNIGDALMRSLPPGLEELRLIRCPNVTAATMLDHVPALRLLYSAGTQLAPATLAACRTRGCTAPAPDTLQGRRYDVVTALAVLADGRLAVGDWTGGVHLWDVVAPGAPMVSSTVKEPPGGVSVQALATMPGGRRLAVGVCSRTGGGGIEVWDVVSAPPVRCASIDCNRGVKSLAVLADGRLAAGCADGAVRIVDVDAGVVAAVLEGHSGNVVALSVMPGGRLASGSEDTSVRVWDVGARACVCTLAGHTGQVESLAVLADGRLASGSRDGTVRLWDVLGAGACVGVLSPSGHTRYVTALAALPDGRLAAGTEDGGIWLCDTSPAAAATTAGSSRAAGALSIAALGCAVGGVKGLVVLPDGRIASAHSVNTAVYLWEAPPPAA